MTVCAIGQERGHGDPRRNGGRLRPEGFRKAARIMRLAAELRMPLITFIDTPGAHLDYDSEARGLAGALSSCLANMSVLPVPVVSVVIGEGGSGPALALGVADRILMQEHAVYSVIAPEGAAAIVHRDAARAQEIADALEDDRVRLSGARAWWTRSCPSQKTARMPTPTTRRCCCAAKWSAR